MFSIGCATLSDFDEYEELHSALAEVNATVSQEAPTSRPSYQFDYREVGLETVETVLSYAGIAATNTPVGASGLFEPRGNQGEWVVFPLSGLEEHLGIVTPDAVRVFGEYGSLDHAASNRADLTPGDQLAIAVLECLHFCKRNQLVLAFSW